MSILDNIVKSTCKEDGKEVKYPSFAISNRKLKKEIKVKENNDPPVVTHAKEAVQRTNSEKYYDKQRSFEEYQLKNSRQGNKTITQIPMLTLRCLLIDCSFFYWI